MDFSKIKNKTYIFFNLIKEFILKSLKLIKKDFKTINRREFFIFSILNFVCFISPSILYSLFYDNYNYRLDLVFLLAFIPFSMFMAISKLKLNLFVIIIFTIMELVQFSHIFYFGTPITPFEIELIWKEQGEILESGLDTFPYCFIPILAVLIPYITLWILYVKKRKSKGSFIASFFVIIILSILPKKALTGGKQVINNLMPRNDMVSIYNSLSSFSGYIFNRLLLNHNTSIKEYEPYQVIKQNSPDNVNIVLIVGESVNPSRMHLFGYERPTTPHLDELAKTDKNFVYGRALSSSVLTTVSTTMLANVQREPDNILHLRNQPTHLFKLAKENGFTTMYISAQDNAIVRGFAPDYIDVFHTKEYAPIADAKKGDLVILDKLDEFSLKFGKKNFIILHQRNIHSPYDKGYRDIPRFKKYITPDDASWEEKKLNSYDNAMLFNDYFIYQVIKYFRENSHRKTYIFWVPDHSELLGEDGLWGHSIVNENVAKIPFVFTIVNKDDDTFVKKLKSTFMPTHYEFGKMIAELLGYKIINSNEKKGIFYINGNVINGDAGWFEVDKSDGKTLKITKHMP